ncbi:MAG: hypothetical protein K2K04_02700 [Clostridia bacterium]|nr:hypothetical protein [Clostridia bacterium]
MKRIKIFFAIILSAFCLLIPFAGCSSTSSYKVDFNYTVSYRNSVWESSEYYINYKLKITLPHAPDKSSYEIAYTLNIYEDGLVIKRKRITEEFSILGNKTVELSLSNDIGKNIEKDKIKAKITNITINEIKENNKKHDYTPYAIGFGVTGGVLLIGAIVVFVLDKTGVFKKRK